MRLSECFERCRVMREEQNGSRKDQREKENMFVENGIKKVYDTVNRRIICMILENIGVSGKIVRIIKSMYENMRATYSLGDTETGCVKCKRGVKQGCVLSPLLFGVYTEVRIRKTGLGIRVGTERLSMLIYADDIVVMSEDNEELHEMLDVAALI